MAKRFIPMFIIAAALTGVALNAVFPAFMGEFATPGNVFGITSEISMFGIQRAMESRAGTMIMQKENLTMFMWTLEHGWAFITIDNTKNEVIRNFQSVTGGGNFVNARTMADLVTFLEKHGWEIISASQVPTTLKTAIVSSGSWIAASSSTLVTFYVMPVGLTEVSQNILIERYRLTDQ